MSQVVPEPPATLSLQDRLEEWIYRLNEEDHWIFKLYDWGNELWARVFFRAARRRGELVDEEIEDSEGEGRVRFLGPDDVEAFADFCAALDTRYLPPHPLDRASAARALARSSYVPLGIFWRDELVGYVLVRFFFLRRAVNGIWMLPLSHGKSFGKHSFWVSCRYLHDLGLPAYCTIPLGNTPSIHTAWWSAYEIVRTNHHFHVLKMNPRLFGERFCGDA